MPCHNNFIKVVTFFGSLALQDTLDEPSRINLKNSLVSYNYSTEYPQKLYPFALGKFSQNKHLSDC